MGQPTLKGRVMPLPRERLAAIDGVFRDALDLADAERTAFLATACLGDDALRSEVERLLALSAREADDVLVPVSRFVANLAADPAEWPDSRSRPSGEAELASGELVGAYRVVRLLGRGGMAAVYLAERADGGFEQQVALKVLPPTRRLEAIRRFEQERQILARLDHPNIARLFDGGVDPRGLPYLVMEHVVGEPIDVHCDARRATLAERLRLVIAVAGALQSAHQRLIVHRDLKPSNLLVTARGDVKLLDFGIAKLLAAEDADPGLTLADGRPMTPTYASPEQVTGQAITTATDVYQLGLLLYELLTGQRPQAGSSASLAALVRAVCETDPPPPSRAVLRAATGADQLAARRQTTPARLARGLAGDLDAVVARALAKDPQRRYASAADLAADLERHLAGQPVLARQGGGWYRASKFARRHAAAVAVAAVAAVLTVGWAVSATQQARALLRERARTDVEGKKAAAVERFLIDLFQVSDPSVSRGEQVTAHELLGRGVERVDRDLAALPEVQARVLSTLGHIHGQLGLYGDGQTLEERALALRRDLLAKSPEPADRERLTRDVAESLDRLAWVRRQRGDLAAAVAPLTEAVALRRRLAPGSPELADSLTELGHLRLQMGDDTAAETLYREVLALRAGLGDRAGLATAEEGLGNLLAARGQHVEAERHHRAALAENLALFGERHPSVSSSLFNIGLALQGQERYAEAQAPFEQALAIDRAVFGERHPDVAIDLLLVGNNAQVRHDLATAEDAFTTALAILEATVPPDHSRRIEALQGVGQLRLAQGRLAEAEDLLRRAVAARRARFGDSHPQVAQMLLPLGQCLVAAGRLAEARETWRSALAMVVGREATLTKRFASELAKLDARIAAGGT
jgi:serine/threonine-protein kinase